MEPFILMVVAVGLSAVIGAKIVFYGALSLNSWNRVIFGLSYVESLKLGLLLLSSEISTKSSLKPSIRSNMIFLGSFVVN
jgi:hypothetical protein